MLGRKDKNRIGDFMIIPVRCFSCGKVVGHLYEDFKKRVAKGEDPKKVLNNLGVERYCCRAVILGNIDLTKKVAQFKV